MVKKKEVCASVLWLVEHLSWVQFFLLLFEAFQKATF